MGYYGMLWSFIHFYGQKVSGSTTVSLSKMLNPNLHPMLRLQCVNVCEIRRVLYEYS